MAEKLIPYSITRFDGGQSENEFLSAGNDFAYSQNLNIYESPKYIELSKAFSQIAAFSPTGYITKILRLPNNIQSNAYFTSVGEIYIDSGAGPALVYTLTDADKYILNAVCFTSFLLVFTTTDIHKVIFTGNDFKTYSSCTEALLSYTKDYQGFSTNESKDLPIYNLHDTTLYFGAGNKLFSIDLTLAGVSLANTVQKGSKIVGLSWFGTSLKIYENHLNVGSVLWFWNQTSSDFYQYKNKVFKSVTTDGQVDYVVATDGLRMYNGVNGTKLFNYNLVDFGKSGANYYVPQNMLAIDPYFLYVAYGTYIFKFGKKFTNLGYGFSISSIESNNITAISDEITVTGTLYYVSDDKKGYSQASTYKTTGYLEGVIFFGASMEKIKKAFSVFNAFDIPVGCTIDVYFSVNGAAYPGSPNFTIAASTTLKFKELFENELNNLTYHWIKVKIVLNGNGTVSPKLYEFTMLSSYVSNI